MPKGRSKQKYKDLKSSFSQHPYAVKPEISLISNTKSVLIYKSFNLV